MRAAMGSNHSPQDPPNRRPKGLRANLAAYIQARYKPYFTKFELKPGSVAQRMRDEIAFRAASHMLGISLVLVCGDVTRPFQVLHYCNRKSQAGALYSPASPEPASGVCHRGQPAFAVRKRRLSCAQIFLFSIFAASWARQVGVQLGPATPSMNLFVLHPLGRLESCSYWVAFMVNASCRRPGVVKPGRIKKKEGTLNPKLLNPKRALK